MRPRRNLPALGPRGIPFFRYASTGWCVDGVPVRIRREMRPPALEEDELFHALGERAEQVRQVTGATIEQHVIDAAVCQCDMQRLGQPRAHLEAFGRKAALEGPRSDD